MKRRVDCSRFLSFFWPPTYDPRQICTAGFIRIEETAFSSSLVPCWIWRSRETQATRGMAYFPRPSPRPSAGVKKETIRMIPPMPPGRLLPPDPLDTGRRWGADSPGASVFLVEYGLFPTAGARPDGSGRSGISDPYCPCFASALGRCSCW